MGLIVNTSDFKGFYDISESCFGDLDDYIDQFEKQFLQNLLGCALADLFIADLVLGVPQDARFVAIFDPFCIEADYGVRFPFQKGCGEQKQSFGMVDCLAGLIYYEFVRNQQFKNTGAGTTFDEMEAAQPVSDMKLSMDIEERLNRGIESYQAIQYKIISDLATYPEFKGIGKEFSFFGGAI